MRSRRRKLAEEEDEAPDERWMASYMDMVTVLMCMFIVLFAMSTVDQKKFEQLANSLATGFGATDIGAIDTAEGIVVPEELVDATDVGFTDLELAIQEVQRLEALRDQIDARLKEKKVEHTVEYELDERGLTVRLVGSETFFTNNSVTLSSAAKRVLDAMAPVLVKSTYGVSVEGHADRRKAVYPYATNWELAAGRSTQVLRRLVEAGGMPADRIASVGFGSARPIASGGSAAALAKNRRVDVVVLSDQPESIRSLIPMVVERDLANREPPAKVDLLPRGLTSR
jgi:chemotaxis protein MotB